MTSDIICHILNIKRNIGRVFVVEMLVVGMCVVIRGERNGDGVGLDAGRA